MGRWMHRHRQIRLDGWVESTNDTHIGGQIHEAELLVLHTHLYLRTYSCMHVDGSNDDALQYLFGCT